MNTYDVVRPIGHRPSTSTLQSRPERLWGAEDVAAFLGVPLRTVYQWRYTRYGPPGRRVGRYLRYDPADVRAWFGGSATRSSASPASGLCGSRRRPRPANGS